MLRINKLIYFNIIKIIRFLVLWLTVFSCTRLEVHLEFLRSHSNVLAIKIAWKRRISFSFHSNSFLLLLLHINIVLIARSNFFVTVYRNRSFSIRSFYQILSLVRAIYMGSCQCVVQCAQQSISPFTITILDFAVA